MKIVVTASGETPDSKVDMRFGRAAYFMLFDEAAKEHAVKNDCKLNAAQGAGIQAAERVAELGAKILISGHCGPKAFRP
jgi:predicted Fe-Mo cluster-binding NifX family protein